LTDLMEVWPARQKQPQHGAPRIRRPLSRHDA
jgi:hypothetical protein